MGMERREHPRIYLKLPGECRGKNVWQKVTIYNLSKKGMFIGAQKVEPPGTLIEIYFEFGEEANKSSFHIDAVVVWNREQEEKREGRILPVGMGVRFQKIFPADAEKFLEGVIKAMKDKENDQA